MKFLRHLSAVVLVVAVIVGLGMLWAHASGGGTGPGGDITRVPSHAALARIARIKGGLIRIGPADGGFRLGDTQNLIRTCEIEALLAAVVITIGAVRLRQRRTARAAGSSPG